ncbi:hypothetical protein [Pantoea sp. App145]|uniref:hypothetical protein n=1 Tax=Pantoea sp. App145 TaxID=3071567 RepID=UPI003A7F7F79
MNFTFSVIQWLYIRRKGVLELTAWFLVGVFLFSDHAYLGFFVLFLLSAVKILPILHDILRIAKNAYVIKFYNIVIWFLAYTISLKLISYQTGIIEDNLKFSPAIMAIPLSLVLAFGIIMFFSMSMISILQVVSYFSLFMTTRFKTKIVRSRFYLFSTRSFYIVPLLAPIVILTAFVSGPVFKIALLADSSFISDCGEKEKDKMYLRIDSHSCMVSTLDVNVFTSQPVIIKSEK